MTRGSHKRAGVDSDCRACLVVVCHSFIYQKQRYNSSVARVRIWPAAAASARMHRSRHAHANVNEVESFESSEFTICFAKLIGIEAKSALECEARTNPQKTAELADACERSTVPLVVLASPLAFHVILDEVSKRNLHFLEIQWRLLASFGVLLQFSQGRQDRVEHAHRSVNFI